MKEPIVIEKFADNGEHSHWQLIDSDTGDILWSEDDDDIVLPQADVVGRSEQLSCNHDDIKNDAFDRVFCLKCKNVI
jgi:hypothetical protein